jgi:sec-independent protein translocase protein TatA
MGDFAKGIKSFKKNMAEDDASMEASATDKQASGTIPGPNAGTTNTNANQSTAARQG